MKYAVIYHTDPAALDRIPPIIDAHRAGWRRYIDSGELLMIGPYSDSSGALSIFTTREAAETFAREDPFVTEGVVARYEIREWSEVLVPE